LVEEDIKADAELLADAEDSSHEKQLPDVEPEVEEIEEEQAQAEVLPPEDDDITGDSINYTILSAASTTSRICARRVIEKYNHVFHPQYIPLILSVKTLGILNDLDEMVDDFIVVSKNISKARPGDVLNLTIYTPEARRIADLK